MQGLALLIGVIARLIVAVGIIYILFKLGKFLDVLPDVLAKRQKEKE
jgi:hypothetical protein